MEKILTEFGVQPLLLIAQVVNFLVLLWILNKVLYKPILKVLDERKQKIADSLKNAEQIEKKLAQTEEDRENKLEEAAKEAKKIIDDATKSATEIISEAHQKASSDIEDMMQKGKEGIKLEREQMHQEMREEMAEIVITALEKVTGKVISDKDQKKMVEDTVRKM